MGLCGLQRSLQSDAKSIEINAYSKYNSTKGQCNHENHDRSLNQNMYTQIRKQWAH